MCFAHYDKIICCVEEIASRIIHQQNKIALKLYIWYITYTITHTYHNYTGSQNEH